MTMYYENGPLEKGRTVLHDAAYDWKCGNFEDLELVNSALKDKYLLNFAGGYYMYTPLHQACYNGSPQLIRELIVAGASLTKRDDTGLTPFELLDSQFSESDADSGSDSDTDSDLTFDKDDLILAFKYGCAQRLKVKIRSFLKAKRIERMQTLVKANHFKVGLHEDLMRIMYTKVVGAAPIK